MLAPSQPPQSIILTGDCRTILKTLPTKSVHCCVTSPPYFGLRDYGVAAQMGLEQTLDAYVTELVAVFREIHRTLRDDGTCWLNLGDSYAGSWGAQSRERYVASDDPSWHGSQIKNHPKRASNTGTIRQVGVKAKDLYGIPWRVAFALQADGWYLRQDIIWHKPNPMPESVTDRCTKAHEYIFLQK
jgi:DNA modification methylase